MTLPEGVTPEKIVKALRPGSELISWEEPEWDGMFPTGAKFTLYRISGVDDTQEFLPEVAWFSACGTLAGEDPRAFVKAVYPMAKCITLEVPSLWEYYIHLLPEKTQTVISCQTRKVAWRRAARNILDELRKDKP